MLAAAGSAPQTAYANPARTVRDATPVRVSDPARPSDTPGPAGHPCNDFGVAYTSPWWLEP